LLEKSYSQHASAKSTRFDRWPKQFATLLSACGAVFSLAVVVSVLGIYGSGHNESLVSSLEQVTHQRTVEYMANKCSDEFTFIIVKSWGVFGHDIQARKLDAHKIKSVYEGSKKSDSPGLRNRTYECVCRMYFFGCYLEYVLR